MLDLHPSTVQVLQVTTLAAMVAVLCLIALHRPGLARYRDAALGLLVFGIPTAVFWSLLLSAYLQESRFVRGDRLWPVLLIYPAYIGLLLGQNAWSFLRGDFKWYREPVISTIILAILCAILFPIFVRTHCGRASSDSLPHACLSCSCSSGHNLSVLFVSFVFFV